ncbi:MAG TPA: hypothetical protein VGB77_13145 [Abditibacteriaceae bacterium]|jgi:hypothetical protein
MPITTNDFELLCLTYLQELKSARSCRRVAGIIAADRAQAAHLNNKARFINEGKSPTKSMSETTPASMKTFPQTCCAPFQYSWLLAHFQNMKLSFKKTGDTIFYRVGSCIQKQFSIQELLLKYNSISKL